MQAKGCLYGATYIHIVICMWGKTAMRCESKLTMILTYSAHHPNTIQTSLESRGPVCDERRANLLDTVRERELELGDKELLDVGAADILSLLNLNNTEDLFTVINTSTHLM